MVNELKWINLRSNCNCWWYPICKILFICLCEFVLQSERRESGTTFLRDNLRLVQMRFHNPLAAKRETILEFTPWNHFAPKNGSNLWHNFLQMKFHKPFAAKRGTILEFTPSNHFCPKNGSNLWHNFLQMSFRGPLSVRRKTHSHVIGAFNHASYLTCLLHLRISMPTTATGANCKKKQKEILNHWHLTSHLQPPLLHPIYFLNNSLSVLSKVVSAANIRTFNDFEKTSYFLYEFYVKDLRHVKHVLIYS